MYNKIFTKILDSSIWLESDQTRIVWLTMLASMDQDGFCQFASAANLAHRAIVSLEAAEAAVKVLESPDQHSSDPENEGRRIERVNGGWMVLNASKYREMVTAAESRRKNLERVQRHRKKLAETKCNATVTPRNDSVMQSEAYAEAHTETIKPSARKARGGESPVFQKAYACYPKHVARGAASKAWNKAVARRKEGRTVEDTEDFLFQRVMTYGAACQRAAVEQKFIPHMSRWLNDDRFKDDPKEWDLRPASGPIAYKSPSNNNAADDELRRQGVIR